MVNFDNSPYDLDKRHAWQSYKYKSCDARVENAAQKVPPTHIYRAFSTTPF